MRSKRMSYFKSKLKTRSEETGEKYIEGYFAVFNQKTELWEGWNESIMQGAFANSILNNDIRCLFNHDPSMVMGRQQSGTLELKEDEQGLWGKVRINEADTMALDVYARVERGDISGCSFGFMPVTEEAREEVDGIHWAVIEADTFEVSICTFPAYPQTEIQARKKDYETMRKKEFDTKKNKLKNRIGKINVKTN